MTNCPPTIVRTDGGRQKTIILIAQKHKKYTKYSIYFYATLNLTLLSFDLYALNLVLFNDGADARRLTHRTIHGNRCNRTDTCDAAAGDMGRCRTVVAALPDVRGHDSTANCQAYDLQGAKKFNCLLGSSSLLKRANYWGNFTLNISG